jgi:hypothetical protein
MAFDGVFTLLLTELCIGLRLFEDGTSYEIKAVIAASRPTAVLATTTRLTKARRFISAIPTQHK